MTSSGHVMAFSPGFMAPADQRGEPRIFISHGTKDQVLAIDRTSRRIVPQLARAGYDVQYQEFDGPHTVPPEIARQALEWFLAPDVTSAIRSRLQSRPAATRPRLQRVSRDDQRPRSRSTPLAIRSSTAGGTTTRASILDSSWFATTTSSSRSSRARTSPRAVRSGSSIEPSTARRSTPSRRKRGTWRRARRLPRS